MADNFTFKKIKVLGVLSTSRSLWTKELALVSWNGKPPVLDIREWAPDGERMSKGCTFTEPELRVLADIVERMPILEKPITP